MGFEVEGGGRQADGALCASLRRGDQTRLPLIVLVEILHAWLLPPTLSRIHRWPLPCRGPEHVVSGAFEPLT